MIIYFIKRFFSLILFLSIVSCSTPSILSSDLETPQHDTPPGESGCINLFVVIANQGQSECKVVNMTCEHGYYVTTWNTEFSSARPAIAIGTESFGRGPDCLVTIECGTKTSVLSVQQNLCFTQAGSVTAKVVSGECIHQNNAGGSLKYGLPGTAFFSCNN